MQQKKKIAIIGTVGLPAKYGGFETLAEHLVKQLGQQYDMTVYCSQKKYARSERQQYYHGAKLHYIPLDANGVQSIAYDTWSILHALLYADVLLILGVAGAWLLPFVRFFTRKKIIISIDGIEWKRNKWNRLAKWYLRWAEKMAVRHSHADIADNEAIQDYTALRYGSLSHIIEYGANHTYRVQPNWADKEKYPFLARPYAFKVCRIEPENNIHMVLEAFASLAQYTLVIVGNWAKSEYGQQLRSQYAHCNNILMLDPVYDQRQLDLLRGNAFVYVHGHSAGGTNPSLVEAMYLGLPVVAFDVPYNQRTTEQKAFYFNNAEALQHIIQTTHITDWKYNGQRMQAVANRRYTWEVIAQKYHFLVQQVLENNQKVAVRPTLSNMPAPVLLQYGAAHLQNQSLFYEAK